MSITVIDEKEQITDGPTEYVPVGHIAELSWLILSEEDQLRTRPTRALCGAEILGIVADVDHVKCQDCLDELDMLLELNLVEKS